MDPRPPPADAWDFHTSLPEYAPTPLRELPAPAREFTVSKVFVQDESTRLGLPAFKALGAADHRDRRQSRQGRGRIARRCGARGEGRGRGA
ncbi:hypothetical protein ABZ953_28675 [Streptomyces sp. NPDC046465]|uniref:hypothetical protein n=1 Tax=Streptomyces sp. NPDC046465 TaxID=3155810 RepID=UPI0033D4B797